jgi:hypothetical protein
VTQKRRPRWFELPQSGHAFDGSGTVCAGSPRGAKLTSGAGGRCSGGTGGCAAGAGGGGGKLLGASAVAASEAGTSLRGESPTGGVGGATRGASL